MNLKIVIDNKFIAATGQALVIILKKHLAERTSQSMFVM